MKLAAVAPSGALPSQSSLGFTYFTTWRLPLGVYVQNMKLCCFAASEGTMKTLKPAGAAAIS